MANSPKNIVDIITTTSLRDTYTDGTYIETTTKETKLADANQTAIKPEVKKTVYLSKSNYWMMMFLVFIQIMLVTMVYGPIAAFLVELFPTRIRYSSMSLPYHIGNGVFGGLTPLIAEALVLKTGNIYAGLYYPIIVAGITVLIGSILIKERKMEE